jgi:serine/threonine-protein phosphatase PPG1
VHGGLSPAIETILQIESLDRFMEIPHDGPLCDLMWSDPSDQPDATGFAVSPRGAGYIFGEEVLEKFLFLNGFKHLTRAHQLCNEGYLLLFKDQLSTVWSAPNYLYRFENLASIMEVDEYCNKSFNIFSDSP